MSQKIIFLDFDGPMINHRSALQFKDAEYAFDPFAVAAINSLCSLYDARIVLSTTHAMLGKARMSEVLESNGINPALLADDWVTPRKMSSSRSQEITFWLDNHSDVTTYVAIDDIKLSAELIPFAVHCSAYEGLSYRNYLEAKHILSGSDDNNSTIEWLRTHEVNIAISSVPQASIRTIGQSLINKL